MLETLSKSVGICYTENYLNVRKQTVYLFQVVFGLVSTSSKNDCVTYVWLIERFEICCCIASDALEYVRLRCNKALSAFLILLVFPRQVNYDTTRE